MDQPDILCHAGYTKKGEPTIDIVKKNGDIETICLRDFEGTISFDTSKRYCIGWYDLETGKNKVCEKRTAFDTFDYDQCRECQMKTGFNPAFYNTTEISPQQEKRNREPHFLYLAYFAPKVIKVGISYAGRGLARLYEQGARMAMVLETFDSANLARTYEAKISALDGFCEAVNTSKKMNLLKLDFSKEEAEKELKTALNKVKEELGVSFKQEELVCPNDIFLEQNVSLSEAINQCEDKLISGKFIGQIGTILIFSYKDSYLLLPIKKFTGYPIKISKEIAEIELPEIQASLF